MSRSSDLTDAQYAAFEPRWSAIAETATRNRANVARMRQEGAKATTIAATLGLSLQTVYRHMRTLGGTLGPAPIMRRCHKCNRKVLLDDFEHECVDPLLL